MDQRVTLQSPTVTQGVTGGQTTSWSTEATVWAHIEETSEREYMAATQRNAEKQLLFVIRFGSNVSGVDSTWRIQHGGNNYDLSVPILKPAARPERIEIVGTLRNADT